MLVRVHTHRDRHAEKKSCMVRGSLDVIVRECCVCERGQKQTMKHLLKSIVARKVWLGGIFDKCGCCCYYY